MERKTNKESCILQILQSLELKTFDLVLAVSKLKPKNVVNISSATYHLKKKIFGSACLILFSRGSRGLSFGVPLDPKRGTLGAKIYYLLGASIKTSES